MASANTDIAEKIRLMEKRIEALTVRVKETEEERAEMERRLKDQQEERVSQGAQRGMDWNNRQNTTTIYSSRPPKFLSLASKVSSWEKRMSLFLQTQGVGYTLRRSTNPVPIINSDDREGLVYR